MNRNEYRKKLIKKSTTVFLLIFLFFVASNLDLYVDFLKNYMSTIGIYFLIASYLSFKLPKLTYWGEFLFDRITYFVAILVFFIAFNSTDRFTDEKLLVRDPIDLFLENVFFERDITWTLTQEQYMPSIWGYISVIECIFLTIFVCYPWVRYGREREVIEKEQNKTTTSNKPSKTKTTSPKSVNTNKPSSSKFYSCDEVTVIIKPKVIPSPRIKGETETHFYDLSGIRVTKIPRTKRNICLKNDCYLGLKNERWVEINSDEVENKLNDSEFIKVHSLENKSNFS